MAEIRKHEPDAGDGIARLVREALGETIRPVEPGERPRAPQTAEELAETEPEASPSRLPFWDESGPMYNF